MPRRTLDHGCDSCTWLPIRREGWCGGFGPDKADLVIVGEGPGGTEIILGRPFSGRSGELLDATLRSHGINPREVFRTNAVQCPIKPKTAELDSCWPRLRAEIISHEPKIVLTLGKVAFAQVCQSREKLSAVDSALWWQPDLNCWVIPTWHPAASLRAGADDRFFPAISNTVWRVARILKGLDQLPDPELKVSFPWTFFRTPEDTLKCYSYYKKRVFVHGKLTIALDTESRSPGKRPHPEDDRWLMLQLYDGTRAAAIDMTNQNKKSLASLRDLLTNPNITWTFHNAPYDLRVLRHNLGVVPEDRNVRDTLNLGLGLSERANAIGLEPLSRFWLNAPAYKGKLKASGYKHANGPQSDEQWKWLARYGVEDAYYSWNLNRKLPDLVREDGTLEFVKDVLMPLSLTCGRIAARGFPISLEQGEKLKQLWGQRTAELTAGLQQYAASVGWPHNPKVVKSKDGLLNPRSHPQLADLVYDTLQMQPVVLLERRKRNTSNDGMRAVDSDFMLAYQNSELCKWLRPFRAYDRMVSTYVKGIVNEIDGDGLVHPDFNLAGTSTGRLVIKPLLQVLPHYGMDQKAAVQDANFSTEVRRLFPARPGYVIVTADYKQLEMRVAWALSGDVELGKGLLSGDMHTRTAAYVYSKPEEQVSAGERYLSKRVGFGVAYGRTAYTLARGILYDATNGGDERIAQKFIDSFWELYGDYRKYQLECEEIALRTGELTNQFGRKRHWPLITPQNKREVARQAINYAVQGTASDMCSMALVYLEEELTRRKLGYPLYTVHDQVVSEIRIDRLEEGIQCIEEVMTRTPKWAGEAQFPVDVEVGPNLGDVVSWKDYVAA